MRVPDEDDLAVRLKGRPEREVAAGEYRNLHGPVRAEGGVRRTIRIPAPDVGITIGLANDQDLVVREEERVFSIMTISNVGEVATVLNTAQEVGSNTSITNILVSAAEKQKVSIFSRDDAT